MDVVVWLRSLGLGKYEAVFRENNIDETVLPSLTHENLKELGIASLAVRQSACRCEKANCSSRSDSRSALDNNEALLDLHLPHQPLPSRWSSLHLMVSTLARLNATCCNRTPFRHSGYRAHTQLDFRPPQSSLQQRLVGNRRRIERQLPNLVPIRRRARS